MQSGFGGEPRDQNKTRNDRYFLWTELSGCVQTEPVYDTAGEAAYVYRVYSLPAAYFIDAGGHVIAQAVGAIDAK